jgi:transcriptional regulator with XRE-family HTH domain
MLALGRFIRERRQELGLTQTELGARIGYYQERISALERGGYGIPSLHSMYELATALEVPVARLLAEAGCLTGETGSGATRHVAVRLQERRKQVMGEYEIVRERLSRTEALAEEVLSLRRQLALHRGHLREVTESCVQQTGR